MLRLKGDDALNFVHSFFCPSMEEINNHKDIQAKRNEHVSVKNTDDGFIGDVDDLDLSFLKEK